MKYLLKKIKYIYQFNNNMQRLQLLLIIVLILLTPAVVAAQSALYKEAEAHLEKTTEADTEEAVRLFQKVIAQNTSFSTAYFGLAKAYRKGIWNYEWDVALLDSVYWAGHEAVRHDPHLTEAYTWLANTYRAYANHSSTRLLLVDAVESNPDDSQLHTLLGRNYFDTGNCGMARPHLERALELGAVPLTYRYSGWCAFYLRKPEQQQEYFHRYLEEEPDNDQGMGGLVWSYTMQKQFDEAISIAERFVEEKQDIPNYSWIVANAGEVYLFAGNKQKAEELYERALAIDSTAINQFAARRATTTLGHLYWEQGRYDEAKKLLNSTIENRLDIINNLLEEYNGIPIPERWEFAYDIASAYAAMDNRKQAYRWLFRAVMAGYPAHLAYEDPLMVKLHDDPAYKRLVKRARLRIESTWDAAGEIGIEE